jgi:hypothetical protein
MNSFSGFNPSKKLWGPLRWTFLALFIPCLAIAQTQPVAVTVAAPGQSAELSPRFLGLSYESSMLLPKEGRYYFDANDQALVNIFKTLGIQSLRIGANAVDDPSIPIPQEKDIDALFSFARAAGVKVIYSFRLKNGDPADAARLASYIASHYADLLDSFSIGNEPNFYFKTYESFFAEWKPIYDAILKAVPQAMLDGPSTSPNKFTVELAKDLFAGGHLAMASDHHYFLKSGRAGETNPPATRARFLANKLHDDYEKDYAQVGAVLAARGVPYRIDEMNSCYDGGAKEASDTYASALWALDCTHWWAAHHIQGVNFHTGELVGRDGKFGPPNYAAFLRQADGQGFVTRPQGYAYLAFSQGALGRPLEVKISTASTFNFNAYAYQDADGSIHLTLINKSYGDKAQPAKVSLQLPPGTNSGAWQQLDLTQKDSDVAAKSGVLLGGAVVDAQGIWPGQWKKMKGGKAGKLTLQVAPASATILQYSPAK